MSNFGELNSISGRKLRGNTWILLTGKHEPIVVDKKTYNLLITNNLDLLKENSSFMDIMKDAGFLKLDNPALPDPISESQSKLWAMTRYGAWILGVSSLLFICYVTLKLGIPTGDKLINRSINPLSIIIFIILFTLLTTIIHEIMHLLFGQSNPSWKSIHLSAKIAVAKVPLSHIWTWTVLGRITAVSAGIIADLSELAIFSGLSLITRTWFISAACSILWIRILWQFRIHKRTDGQLLLALLFDKPFLHQDLKNSNTWYSIAIKILGNFVTLLLIGGWLIPLCIRIYQLVI